MTAPQARLLLAVVLVAPPAEAAAQVPDVGGLMALVRERLPG